MNFLITRTILRFKKIFLVPFLLLTLFSIQVKGQKGEKPSKLNVSRLSIDFEVKNESNPDTSLLNSINLDNYEVFRQLNSRVEVPDTLTGFVLILYSQTEATVNRGIAQPLHRMTVAESNQPKIVK